MHTGGLKRPRTYSSIKIGFWDSQRRERDGFFKRTACKQGPQVANWIKFFIGKTDVLRSLLTSSALHLQNFISQSHFLYALISYWCKMDHTTVFDLDVCYAFRDLVMEKVLAMSPCPPIALRSRRYKSRIISINLHPLINSQTDVFVSLDISSTEPESILGFSLSLSLIS